MISYKHKKTIVFLIFFCIFYKNISHKYTTKMIIDGKKIAEEWYNTLKSEIEKLDKTPCLAAILVWKNEASLKYIAQKQKWAHFVGIEFKLLQFEETISENTLLEAIHSLNNDISINGFIVQLPLPPHIQKEKIIEAISPNKDVDWFHPINQWKILIWEDTGFVPCTPDWVMDIFKKIHINISWKNIVIIGRSNIVGKPLVNMCINAWATVISCNSKTKDIASYTKTADIVVLAAWVPWLLSLDMINEKTVVIDVWFTMKDGKIYGDAQFDEINNNGNMITPVPGWVWALTVLHLMKNTYKAYLLQNI